MAGLLAARVLSDHFDRVTLIERDQLPERAEPRNGIPQGRHVHVLLARGIALLEENFPGLTRDLVSAGAFRINGGRDIAWHYGDGWRTRHLSDLELVAASRPLIETHVAARVRGLSNVDLRDGVRLAGPATQADALTGAQITGPQGPETIDADLLVDASGRGSSMSRRLEQLGYTPPEAATIPARLSYSSCQFDRGGQDPGWRALIVNGPAARRAGFCLAVEGDRWLVTLASFFDEPSPFDLEDFRSFARSLPVPDLHEAIRGLAPASKIVQFRFPASRRRRYERLSALPSGLIATGDAICSFNPVYGQGMTVAALEAKALGHALAEARRRGRVDPAFTRDWYRAAARIVDVAWQGVAIEDYRFPELAGRRTAALRALQWYMSRVGRATHADAAVTEQFYRVIGFLEPPAALFRPRIAAAVLRPRRGQ